jgi:hypothetical protein
MADNPTFAATPRLDRNNLSAANSARDGTGTLVDVCTATGGGVKIESVVVQATATTTAGMVRLFVHDGSTSRLFDEVAVAAVTPSASVAAFRARRVYPDLVLEPGHKLQASTHNAETFVVHALGGEL